MRVLAPLALLIAAALSGCAAHDPDDRPQVLASGLAEPQPEDRDAPLVRGALDQDGEGNSSSLPPVPSLEADAVSGTAPLLVTFTADAEDPDGDTFYWGVFEDLEQEEPDHFGTGDELPFTFTREFGAGNHTMFLVVVDEHDALDVAWLNLTVDEPSMGDDDGDDDGNTTVEEPEVDLCPTDDAAQAAGPLYFTVGDLPGGMWIYEESNGEAGLQRDDETVDTECPTPDTIIF